MSDGIIDKMTTNWYKILRLMYYNQVERIDGSIFTPMTQVEIAEQIGVSKITINALFKELQAEGLLYPFGASRGRYCLTNKSILIIKQIETLNDKLKGDKY